MKTQRGGRRDNSGGPRYKIVREVRDRARALRAEGHKLIAIASALDISVTAAWRASKQP